MSPAVVIVGAGQAGFQVAASLRGEGFAGTIRLIGAEPHPPYQRPPLSKGLLLGKMEPARLLFRQPAFYAAQTIELDLGRAVASIDRSGRSVIDEAGTAVPYDTLVLATGTRAALLRTVPWYAGPKDQVARIHASIAAHDPAAQRAPTEPSAAATSAGSVLVEAGTEPSGSRGGQ